MPTLDFKGKNFIYAHHHTVPHRPLEVDLSRSLLPDTTEDSVSLTDQNLIIHGDNLHALKALLPNYAGRVKCIYIDPPYNTGKKDWCYSDNVNSPLMQAWLKENKPVDGEDLERHDKWLCMMWPRLKLLKNLLRDDGVIFVSIDDNEVHHLRMLMDQIFGEKNFFAMLTRKAMHTVRNSSKDFNLNADYILAYAKDKSWFTGDKKHYIRHMVDKSDNYPHDDNDGRGRYKLDPLHARNYYEPYEYTFTDGTHWSAPSGSYPRYSPETLAQKELDGRISFSGKEPRAKRYLQEVQRGQPPDAILRPEIVGFNADGTRGLREIFGVGGVFPQPKPVQLIQFFLELMQDRNSLVLDSFAGSGTTAHAVLALNKEDGGKRRFILVECEDYADTITAERVRRVIIGNPDARDQQLRQGLGGSFAYCTLGEPLEIDSLLTGEQLPTYSDLAAYLLYTATGITTLGNVLISEGPDGHFWSCGFRDYYLIYRQDLDFLRSNEAALNQDRALRIHQAQETRQRPAIVFAAAKYISQDKLSKMNITFCQLPYEMLSKA